MYLNIHGHRVDLCVCFCNNLRLVVLGLVVASLKEGQESPDVEGCSTEAMGAESKTKTMVINLII